MARSQENGTTILLGLKGYRLGRVKEGDEGVVVEVRIGGEELSCPYCGKTKLYRHGRCQP
jgi:hypothetical protein